ncbi:MAG: response regulator [Thermodesulfobacteriota bacterium]
MNTPRILIVEDEFVLSQYLRARLAKMGYQVCASAASGEEAVRLAAESHPDAVIMDVVLGGPMDGIEAARRIRFVSDTPVIFLTAHADEDLLDRAKAAESFAYLIKPFQDRELRAAIEMALHKARLESRLRSEEERLRSIIKNNPHALAVLDRDYRFFMVSDRFLKEYDLGGSDPAGRLYSEVFPDTARPGRGVFARVLEGATLRAEEDVFVRADGTRDFIRWECRPWRDPKDRVGGIILYSEIITKRKESENALRESEDRYRLLVQNAPLGIMSVGQAGEIRDFNPKLAELLGAPSVQDLKEVNVFSFPPLVQAGISERFRTCLETGRPLVFEALYHGRWGQELHQRYHLRPITDAQGRITGVQAVAEDITLPKRLEAQLRQTHKMEAVGTLAGGIAHDFNNILAAIVGYTELARLDLPPGSPVRSHLDQVFQGALRAKDLVRQILTFSRQTEQERRPVEIALIVSEGLRFLRASLPTTIEIRQKISEERAVVEADPTQVHQVLMNLCANAAHAMREKGGVLEVSLSTVRLDEEEASLFANLNPGVYQLLSVRDTGPGMEPEILERVFEPFFTTKGPGEGTGMGLAVVHGIIRSHGGTITVDSLPGQGTTFNTYLPLIEGPPPSELGPPQAPATGSETILFVDDEPPLAQFVFEALSRLGYKVVTRTDPRQALADFQDRPEAFDLVITDMTMPHLTGEQMAARMLALRPDLPIILCTGFSEMILEEKARALGIEDYIMKPFETREFAGTVRRVLDRKAGARP